MPTFNELIGGKAPLIGDTTPLTNEPNANPEFNGIETSTIYNQVKNEVVKSLDMLENVPKDPRIAEFIFDQVLRKNYERLFRHEGNTKLIDLGPLQGLLGNQINSIIQEVNDFDEKYLGTSLGDWESYTKNIADKAAISSAESAQRNGQLSSGEFRIPTQNGGLSMANVVSPGSFTEAKEFFDPQLNGTDPDNIYRRKGQLVENNDPGTTNRDINPSSYLFKGLLGVSEDVPTESTIKARQKKLFDQINEEIKSSQGSGNYELTDLYGNLSENPDGVQEFDNIEDLIKVFPFQGYKNIQGFCMDSTHLWDIRIRPFGKTAFDPHNSKTDTKDSIKDSDAQNKIFIGDDELTNPKDKDRQQGFFEGPEIGPPRLPIIRTSRGKWFDYNEWTPILSYTYNEGQIEPKELQLYGSSSIAIPQGFQFQGDITTTIVESDTKDMTNFMSDYINYIYNQKTGHVIDYKHACYVLEWWMYRQDKVVTSYARLLVMPISYTASHEGTDDVSVNILNIGWRVVGILPSSRYKNSSTNGDLKLGKFSLSSINLSLSQD